MIEPFKRLLKIDLPERQSAFLWGARKTGKSTYLKAHYPQAPYYDLLKSDLYLHLSKEPHVLREELLIVAQKNPRQLIIIDEVQKIPLLLDEIHWLIENTELQFILCGSSARKLKRGAANLLGGRAWKFHFLPLAFPEIPQIDLLRVLNNGLLPSHYHLDNARRSLKAYVEDYLIEEIQAEGLVRNLPAFARFFDILAFSQGALVNFSNIARDCGVDAKTVKAYYQILVDTLIGYFIYPFNKHQKRDVISVIPKFYLFDVGLVAYLSKTKLTELKGSQAGIHFEHYIFMELMAYKQLREADYDIYFWRTKSGLEVDFILGNAAVAIEIKISQVIDKTDAKGLLAFLDDFPQAKAYLIAPIERKRLMTVNEKQIIVIPWHDFLTMLWQGEIIAP